MTRSIVTEARQSNKALDEPAIAENPQPFKPRFSISARSEANQEVEDVREKAKIVRKA